MTIARVAAAADSNPAGASAFVAISQPVGIQNGDVVVVAIALPVAGVTVTPPSTDWTRIAATDPSQALSLVAFWTTALNLPSNLVFALSASCQAVGALVAYRSTDPFAPVEAFAATLTASSSTHNVPAITASQAGEEALLFMAGATSGTYTPLSGFVLAARKQQANATIEAQARGLQNAGTLAATNETFSATAIGASLIVVLAPSAATTSYDDAYQRILDTLPKGIDNILDFTPGAGDFYWYFWVIGAVLKTYGHDLVDLVRQEILAHTSRYKLPDWQSLFGIKNTNTALLGTLPQQQAQVLGSWRSAAGQGSSIPAVQAVLGPLLGYFPTTPVEVIECDRSMLTLLHSYGSAVDVTLPAGQTTTLEIAVTDGGKVGKMGAHVTMHFALGDLSLYTFTLTTPNGVSQTFNTGWTNVPLKLYFTQLAGAVCNGTWKLAITNGSGSQNTLYSGQWLFVEGIGRGLNTGGAVFEWGALADAAHIGENGNPMDRSAALLAVQRLTFSHCFGSLYLSKTPQFDTTSGAHAALYDFCTWPV
jgi:hypothetical protein